MVILGIETSCDETSASVVKDGRKVLSHVLASSADMHTKTGGIIPEVAAREQLKSILPVISEALRKGCGWVMSNESSRADESWVKKKKNSPTQLTTKHTTYNTPPIDAIAVTAGGPGLIGSMLVGIETAKTLAWVWNKPIVPVVHLLAHMYANWLLNSVESSKYNVVSKRAKNTHTTNYQLHTTPIFPAIVLTVSGGHTELILMKDHGSFQMLGGTRDDSAGEAFDKTARLLGLPYPGGPSIAKAAMECQISNDKLQMFPRPMINGENFDFSFSGLKTAVAREVKRLEFGGEKLDVKRIAAEVQEAIVDVLVTKTLQAVKEFHPKSLLLAGGVAANTRLREEFELKIENLKLKINLHIPPVQYCTDNGSFIASFAYFNYHPLPWEKIVAIPDADEAIKIYAKSKG